MCSEELTLITETREWTECRALQKKGSWEKSLNSILWVLSKRKSTHTSDSRFAERIRKVKKTKFELELIRNRDCFLDGQGNYDSTLVSLRRKSLLQTILMLQLAIVHKEYKMLVKNGIPKQKLSSFVRFQNKIFRTRQILN